MRTRWMGLLRCWGFIAGSSIWMVLRSSYLTYMESITRSKAFPPIMVDNSAAAVLTAIRLFVHATPYVFVFEPEWHCLRPHMSRPLRSRCVRKKWRNSGPPISSRLAEESECGKIQAGYDDYESLWQSGAGSGSENKKFLDKLDELPGFAENIEPALQRKAAANIKGDAGFASEKGLPLCSGIQNAREIFVEQGRAG